MDNKQQGAELNQLSRILFNKAAWHWQWYLITQVCAGFIGIASSLAQPSLEASIVTAVITVIVLFVSFYFRFRFDGIYDAAETMRRQSVLSEGLNWPISRAQFNEWKSMAGIRVLAAFSVQQRAPDYYETQRTFGPKRLAEMTFESAYWTKSLYRKLWFYLGIVICFAALVFVIVLSASPFIHSTAPVGLYIVYAVYLLIPILLSIDFVGLMFRISRNIKSLIDIERSLEALSNEENPKIEEVMRLVSEYNCVVVCGIPIPDWVFKLHHGEIQQIWDKR